MNFVAWFANIMIDFFGLSSDIAIGSAVFLGIFMLLVIAILIASIVAMAITKLGWIRD